MDINQSNLDILFRGFRLDYQSAYDQTPTWYDQLATTIPSGETRSVTYGWMDRIPILRKWLGNRVINAAITHSREVFNEPYEDTVALDKYDVEDDRFGIFSFTMKGLGEASKKWPDVQLASFLRSRASTENGFDGVPMFSTAHPLLGGDVASSSAAGGLGGVTGVPSTQSNLLLNTALSYDTYVAARAQMRSWRGADGQPLTVNPNVLAVAPNLEGLGKLILESDFASNINGNAAAPQSNIWKGSAKLLVIPELGDKPNNWFLFDTTKVVKPLLWQLRSAPVMTQKTAPTDDNVFNQHQFLYGVEARGACAETLWFLGLAGSSAASY
jgi:phage major head subunit gpT-like protein